MTVFVCFTDDDTGSKGGIRTNGSVKMRNERDRNVAIKLKVW